MPHTTVFIADGEKRRSEDCLRLLRTHKSIRILGTGRTAHEAVAGAVMKPHIILLDLKISKNNGVPTLMLIRAKSPHTKVILLPGRASDSQILEGISQGARGYLSPVLVRKFVVKAVQVVNAGESWVSRAMVAKIIDRLARLSLKKARIPKG